MSDTTARAPYGPTLRLVTDSVGNTAIMSDQNSGPAEGIKGVVEDVKGKAKEAVGTVTGRGDLVNEGEAQQDKAEAQREAAKKEAQADAARAGAAAAEKRQQANQ